MSTTFPASEAAVKGFVFSQALPRLREANGPVDGDDPPPVGDDVPPVGDDPPPDRDDARPDRGDAAARAAARVVAEARVMAAAPRKWRRSI